MLFLSNSAIQYAVNICREEDGRKIGFVINNKRKINLMNSLLSDMLADASDVEILMIRTNQLLIRFKNKSEIRLIPCLESSRMYRVHLMIVDRSVPPEFVQTILHQCEIRDWMEYRHEHTPDR